MQWKSKWDFEKMTALIIILCHEEITFEYVLEFDLLWLKPRQEISQNWLKEETGISSIF